MTKYININGYLIPDFMAGNPELPPWGHYGELRLRYLEEHQPFLFDQLTIAGRLHEHLLEIDREASRIVYDTVCKMAATQSVGEEMKRHDPIEWAQQMNNFKQSAEEIVLRELIFAEEECR